MLEKNEFLSLLYLRNYWFLDLFVCGFGIIVCFVNLFWDLVLLFGDKGCCLNKLRVIWLVFILKFKKGWEIGMCLIYICLLIFSFIRERICIKGRERKKIIFKNIFVNVKYMLFGMGSKERYFISFEYRVWLL